MARITIPVAGLALGQVGRRPLREEAGERLRAAIISGELQEGERLNEAHISAALGISRGPLREALRELEEEGRLVSRPGRGTYVKSITVEDIVEAITVRELVEPFVIRRAMEADTGALLASLRGAVDAMRKGATADDSVAVASAHVSFHAAFYAHADHRLLLQIWERVRVPIRPYVQLQELGFKRLTDVPQAHLRLLTLVKDGEVETLVQEATRHLRMNLPRITEAVGPAAPARAPARTRMPVKRPAARRKR